MSFSAAKDGKAVSPRNRVVIDKKEANLSFKFESSPNDYRDKQATVKRYCLPLTKVIPWVTTA
jgi:hypothetical protein